MFWKEINKMTLIPCSKCNELYPESEGAFEGFVCKKCREKPEEVYPYSMKSKFLAKEETISIILGAWVTWMIGILMYNYFFEAHFFPYKSTLIFFVISVIFMFDWRSLMSRIPETLGHYLHGVPDEDYPYSLCQDYHLEEAICKTMIVSPIVLAIGLLLFNDFFTQFVSLPVYTILGFFTIFIIFMFDWRYLMASLGKTYSDKIPETLGHYLHGVPDEDYQFPTKKEREEKVKKKRRFKMPRIFRYVYYWLLISLLWKFVANIDVIVAFLVNKYL